MVFLLRVHFNNDLKRRYAGAERDQTQGRPASGHQAKSFQLKNTKITGKSFKIETRNREKSVQQKIFPTK